MVCSTFPYPPTRGGTQVRTFHLLQYLSQNHSVTLLTRLSPDVTEEDVAKLREIIDLMVFPAPEQVSGELWGKIWRFGEFFWQGTPGCVSYYYSREIQNWLDEVVAGERFDVITCEHSVNEVYIRPQWREKIKTVVNIHSSIYLTCKHQLAMGISANKLRDRLYLPLLKRYERGFLKKFSHIVVTTPEDCREFQSFSPHLNISIVPNGVDLATFPARHSDPNNHNLIITGGMDYIVNIDAACFFSLEVFPLLQKKYPDTHLMIVGAKPVAEVLALAENPAITVTGRVPSLVKYLHQATVCVVPLRSGFGIKNKTLEAMAAGIPVVGSDRGLEGLLVDGENVPKRAVRANKIEEYLAAISRLFEDIQLRSELSYNARSLIEQEYTWEIVGKSYAKVAMGD